MDFSSYCFFYQWYKSIVELILGDDCIETLHNLPVFYEQVYRTGEVLTIPGLGPRPGNWQSYHVPETEGFQPGTQSPKYLKRLYSLGWIVLYNCRGFSTASSKMLLIHMNVLYINILFEIFWQVLFTQLCGAIWNGKINFP